MKKPAFIPALLHHPYVNLTFALAVVLSLPVLMSSSCSVSQASSPPGAQATLAQQTAIAQQQPMLQEPKVICAKNRSIDTILRMEIKDWIFDANTQTWRLFEAGDDPAQKTPLRTYGSPAVDPNDCSNQDLNTLEWTIPGPTFRIKAGETFNARLINAMPPESNPYGQPPDWNSCNPVPGNPDDPPNCFHGDNTTNIHYHGFRVSPERPQDWVFLQLKPNGTPRPPENYPHKDDVVIGEYESRLAAITNLQPVGTHWYHPHKHGATALQVINGMAGAFIVEGYFDDDLERDLPGLKRSEKVLVVQQIVDSIKFQDGMAPPANVYVNAQINPVIEMAAGEIQRWRFVGATQQASHHIVIGFTDRAVRSKQIAQDGVPFHNENYQRETLNLSRPDALLSTTLFNGIEKITTAEDSERPRYQLAPGNRVDLLVKAPATPGVEYQMVYEDVSQLAPQASLRLRQARQDNAKVLLTLRVTSQRNPMNFPETLPDLPPYLNDITSIRVRPKHVLFSMDGGPGDPPIFYIDGKQYDPAYIDHRVILGINEQWQLQNSTTIAHPFHIHVNPFQITAFNGVDLPQPWVWWDTIAIPIQQSATEPEGTVTIRQRFLRFTGKYVLHCHILGHEDRGMMQNVEASSLQMLQTSLDANQLNTQENN